ncbi:DUF3037 domain-containing protein [Actinoplanes sp. TRM 88003]|uniref:DUF3037 domain-containing protein n=1 Tax=Paractinoplanes aksuensis TaxID=2939490 RepID=A0ABT1DJ49_9ACTN|nr:DUF3037 domain-containing protein [Actinoplanes aksuensis]MCO8270863.1 DUF3037 domain-containing protein [Actinoplanes aksuensis]
MLYSQRLDFLAARTDLRDDRLLAVDPGADVPAIRAALASWDATCSGSGAAAGISQGERFRWLVAPRSTILRAGPVHMGLAADPSEELDRLVQLLVSVAGD